MLGKARDPIADELWMKLMGYSDPIGWDVLIYVPLTGWSKTNAYFDGIKYNALTMQNPYNVLNCYTDDFWKPDMVEDPRPVSVPKPEFADEEEEIKVMQMLRLNPWKQTYFDTVKEGLKKTIGELKQKIKDQPAPDNASETNEATAASADKEAEQEQPTAES